MDSRIQPWGYWGTTWPWSVWYRGWPYGWRGENIICFHLLTDWSNFFRWSIATQTGENQVLIGSFTFLPQWKQRLPVSWLTFMPSWPRRALSANLSNSTVFTSRHNCIAQRVYEVMPVTEQVGGNEMAEMVAKMKELGAAQRCFSQQQKFILSVFCNGWKWYCISIKMILFDV